MRTWAVSTKTVSSRPLWEMAVLTKTAAALSRMMTSHSRPSEARALSIPARSDRSKPLSRGFAASRVRRASR